mmetsp:Transcript_61351/g.197686  ORF Transcript_61351/g.197686 Transcript_61351/m.197686 type:complete len:250 (-) Transcript_61351:994-1743(-)
MRASMPAGAARPRQSSTSCSEPSHTPGLSSRAAVPTTASVAMASTTCSLTGHLWEVTDCRGGACGPPRGRFAASAGAAPGTTAPAAPLVDAAGAPLSLAVAEPGSSCRRGCGASPSRAGVAAGASGVSGPAGRSGSLSEGDSGATAQLPSRHSGSPQPPQSCLRPLAPLPLPLPLGRGASFSSLPPVPFFDNSLCACFWYRSCCILSFRLSSIANWTMGRLLPPNALGLSFKHSRTFIAYACSENAMKP